TGPSPAIRCAFRISGCVCRLPAARAMRKYLEETFVMTSDGSIRGQVAVVTGGGRGIGAAIAHKLAAMGAVSVICGRNESLLRQTGGEITKGGAKCEPIPCDVTDLLSVEALAARVEKDFGRTDILVNNAGIGGPGGPLHQMPPDAWDQVM